MLRDVQFNLLNLGTALAIINAMMFAAHMLYLSWYQPVERPCYAENPWTIPFKGTLP